MTATSRILAAAIGTLLALTGAAAAQDATTPPAETVTPPEAEAQAPLTPSAETPAEPPASDPEADAFGEEISPAEGEAQEATPAEGATPGTAPAEDGAPGAAPVQGAGPEATPAEGATPNSGPEILEIVRDTFGDWEVRCLPDETDCFMYQLALDAEGNPVAEVSILKLPTADEAAAGLTVVTPLGTLLTEGLVLQVDTGEARQYPFSFCSQVGCFARFGVTEDSIAAMKRGRSARMRLVAAAVGEPVELALSLTGFTAAYDSLEVAAGAAE